MVWLSTSTSLGRDAILSCRAQSLQLPTVRVSLQGSMPWRRLPRQLLQTPWKFAHQYSTIQDSPAVILRPYQELCLSACTDALDSGASRIGVSLPTGSGKTTVFVSLLQRIHPPAGYPEAQRSLVIVNSVELARQAASQTRKICPDWTVEIEQGARHQASGLADVTVATYQTLLQPQRIAKFNPQNMKAIIIDEAHHAAAPSYRRILSYFDSAIKSPDPTLQPPAVSHQIPIVGFSATFSRHDRLALGSVFERIVYHRDFMEMIKEQWLCGVRFTVVRAQIDFSNVTINGRSGDFQASSLAHVVNTQTINKLTVQTWLEKAADRRSTLVFCVNLAHVRDLTQAFRDAGIDARYIHAATPGIEREALISAFKAGSYPVLINCAILTEGADVPNIDCVVIARPTRSRNLYAQMIGRGMRLSPETGKEDCRIIDLVGLQNRGVVCTPSLLGLDPSELQDDDTLESLLQKQASRDLEGDLGDNSGPNVPDPKSVTYLDYEDPFSFLHTASGAPNIYNLSKLAWVGCGQDIYVLECLGLGHIRIEPMKGDEETEPGFCASYTPANFFDTSGVSPFLRSRSILKAKTLEEAIEGCDLYVTQKVVHGPRAVGLLRTAKWRQQTATDAQKAWVRKRWEKRRDASADPSHPQGLSIEEKIAKLTKGEATNMICRLKFGAQARYDKKLAAAKRVHQKAEKERMRQMREEVKLGPLPSMDNNL